MAYDLIAHPDAMPEADRATVVRMGGGLIENNGRRVAGACDESWVLEARRGNDAAWARRAMSVNAAAGDDEEALRWAVAENAMRDAAPSIGYTMIERSMAE